VVHNKFNVYDLRLPRYYRILCTCVSVSSVIVWLFLDLFYIEMYVFRLKTASAMGGRHQYNLQNLLELMWHNH
jgi:hypothetical protein